MLKRLTLLLGTLGFALSAHAQTATGTTGAGAGPQADITITGSVTSSVQLNITGVGATVLSATSTTTAPTAATGTIDFGTFNTLDSTSAISGTQDAVSATRTTDVQGLFVTASLQVTLQYSGASTGTVKLARKAGYPGTTAPDVLLARLRYSTAAAPTWTTSTANSQVPAPGGGADICTGAGGNCVNGTAYTHFLSVWVPDTQATGPFSTVVTYTGTAP